MGACVRAHVLICLCLRQCAYDGVQDIIQNNDIRLDSMFQFSMAMDITTVSQLLYVLCVFVQYIMTLHVFV